MARLRQKTAKCCARHTIEQKVIGKKLDAFEVETKKLEKIYEQKLADLEELKKSILKKTFSGEL